MSAEPEGARPTAGIVHTRSPYDVGETVDRLADAIRAAGAKLFALVDHSSVKRFSLLRTGRGVTGPQKPEHLNQIHATLKAHNLRPGRYVLPQMIIMPEG